MRRNPQLVTRYLAILSNTGAVLLLGGLTMLTPLLALLGWPHEYVDAPGFILPAAIEGGMGFIMWRLLRPKASVVLTLQEGALIVFFSWVFVALFAALPFMMVSGFNFTNAVFESVSGWSGTGLTVSDVVHMPHVLLLWRSITQFVGGAGLALVMLATIVGPLGHNISVAEGRTDQLAPHIRDSAKIVLIIYSGYAVAGTLALWASGMTFFEAVNHTFTALGTGGFSTRAGSIEEFNSPLIEAILIVLMLLGATNFLTAYLFFQGKWRPVFKNAEVRTAAVAIGLSALILAIGLHHAALYPDFRKIIRVALFEPISAMSGTGFQTTVYQNWNGLGLLVLIGMMIMGGGVGSTSGAIKQFRAYLMFKSIVWELRRSMLPKSVVEENYMWYGAGKVYVDDRRIREAANYVVIYLVGLGIGTAILSAYGYSLGDSLFEYASAQGTVGLTIGITTPTAPKVVLWTMTTGMFLGRLEFYVMFVSIVKIAHDVRSMMLR